MKNILYFFMITTLFATGCGQFKSSETKDQYRPQVHFSPEKMWMNDPNGMVYYEGEYHLFYQHYPDSTVWGPMHWGHAISTDLVHWEHMPVALFPDSLGWIFSGSAVADKTNTSGLGTSENPPLVAIYTYHNPELERAGSETFQYQGIAYSIDKGRTWTKYANNPVLSNPGIRDFRDPKVIWHEESNRWIMILAAQDRVQLYSSPDLLEWEYESDFSQNIGAHGGVWECPDLFPMETGDTVKWVMLVSINPGGPNGGSATQYFVGDFDGHQFNPIGDKTKWIDYGKDNYAGVTWSNVPDEDGRRLFIGWMNNWEYANEIPTSGWRGACTLARSLQLIDAAGDYVLYSKPVEEFKIIRQKERRLEPVTIFEELEITEAVGFPLEINLVFDTRRDSDFDFSENFGLRLSNSDGEHLTIGYDNVNKWFYIDRTKAGWGNAVENFAMVSYAPAFNIEVALDMHLIIDKSSVELFAMDGMVVMTEQFFPKEDFASISLFSERGEVPLKEGSIWPLHSIWDEKD